MLVSHVQVKPNIYPPIHFWPTYPYQFHRELGLISKRSGEGPVFKQKIHIAHEH